MFYGHREGSQHQRLPGLPGSSRIDAGHQRPRRRVGHPHRSGPQLQDRRVVPHGPEELLLPGHDEELPALAVRRADLLRRLPRRQGRRRGLPCRDRACPHGGGRRKVPARRRIRRTYFRCQPLPHGLQPRRRPAHRDRHQADPWTGSQGAAGGTGLHGSAARHHDRSGSLRGQDGTRQPAL